MLSTYACLPRGNFRAVYLITKPLRVSELSVLKTTKSRLRDEITSPGGFCPQNVPSCLPVTLSVTVTLSLRQSPSSPTSKRSKFNSTRCNPKDQNTYWNMSEGSARRNKMLQQAAWGRHPRRQGDKKRLRFINHATFHVIRNTIEIYFRM